MVAAMAIDLGIDKAPLDATVTDSFALFDSTEQVFQLRPTQEELEAKRTFLGCYYLSSGYMLFTTI